MALRRFSLILLTLMAFVCVPVRPGHADFDFQTHLLDNGLTVLTLSDHSCPIVAVDLWYHVGSKDEDPERQGFAHMFEHMMFRGTDRLGPTDHFDRIRESGGSCNAYTTFDQTVYTQQVPANQLELVLWLEAERMSMLKIDQESFDTERKVVEEERRLGLNQPYGRMLEKILPELFSGHPYRWSTIGSIPHLRATTVPELREFWTRFYVPNNATLVVVGDVKHENVVELAEKYFGWIPRFPDVHRIAQPDRRPYESREIVIQEKNAPAPIVALAFRGVPLHHDDYLPLQLMATILGGGESSRLYRRLVAEEEAAVFAGSQPLALEQDGVLGVGAVLSPFGGDMDHVIRLMQEVITRLQHEPIREHELQKAKNQMLRNIVLEQLTVRSKASQLGSAAVLEGDPARLNRRREQIENVNVDAIQRLAQEYLDLDHCLTIKVQRNLLGSLSSYLGFGDTEDNAPVTGAKETNPPAPGRPGLQRPANYRSTPPGNPPIPYDPLPHFEERTLPNGLRLLVVENHEVPYVSVTLGLDAGAYTDSTPGTASMACGMLTKGTRNRSEAELADELETNAITLNGSADRDASQVSLRCLTGQLDRGMELLGDVVLNSTFPETEFRKLLKQVRTGVAVTSQEPSEIANREFRRRMYGEHPYARSTTGELADLDRLLVDDVRDWWHRWARPRHATIIIAGDCDVERAEALVQRALGSWSNGELAPNHSLPPIPEPQPRRIILVDYPGDQTQIRVGQMGLTMADPDYHQSLVLSAYFGGSFSSRLNEKTRVEKGLTYGARGGFRPGRFAGEFSVNTFSKHESAGETLRTILSEIDRLRQEPPTDNELTLTKSYYVGSFPGSRETPNDVANELCLTTYLGLPRDFFAGQLKAVAECTADDCLRIAKVRIDPDHLLIVVVGPARTIQADLQTVADVQVVPFDNS